jgi:tRNA-dihydrouridine synthase A
VTQPHLHVPQKQLVMMLGAARPCKLRLSQQLIKGRAFLVDYPPHFFETGWSTVYGRSSLFIALASRRLLDMTSETIPTPAPTRPEPSRRFSVAPMMDWTDRHCRYFLRQLSKQALLYTEMVTTGALLNGDAARFLQHNAAEYPLALQLGGSVPADLAACSRLAQEAGYDEVNLNVGCPSDRVQNNMIGASLMAHPALVASCVKAMQDAVDIPVTIKHRIGIDGRDSYEQLCDFVGQVAETGCRSFTVHARIAILQGLSPKENRDIPPLRYDVVARLKADFPELEIVLNGGIKTLEDCKTHLLTFNGVMLGREAYHNPYLLATVDQTLFGSTAPVITRSEALARMRPYISDHVARGGAMHHVTRHMLGLAQGFPGARRFRQLLSVDIHKAADPLALLDQAGALLDGR